MIELGVPWGQEDGLASQLDHAGFEGHPGPGGGFLEDHSEHPILQRLVDYPLAVQILQLDAALEQAGQLCLGTIHPREKMPYCHLVLPDRDRRLAGTRTPYRSSVARYKPYLKGEKRASYRENPLQGK